MTETGLPNIDHVVVVMMENRSFDNVLGWLYDPRNAPPFNVVPSNFNGLSGANASNPYPDAPVPAQYGSSPTNPNPDPNEKYEFVYSQMWNIFPHATAIPSPPPNAANMQGFIKDYATALAKEIPAADPTQIMNCFTPAQLPVISALASAYAVCDHWFSSVPSQTFTNRSFMHAGTASGFVDNSWQQHGFPPIGFFVNDTPTIFNLLETAGQSWRIYYGGPLLLSQAFLNQKQLQPFGFGSNRRFYPMQQFYTDIGQKETFPSYVFIEPNFIGNPWYGPENDEHPQASPFEEAGPSSVVYGEQLLADIFTKLTQSPEWSSTLLVVLFDEHGGTYDHVVPPSAVPPDGVTVSNPGGWSFTFDRLGVRVPAVLVSPWIGPQVCNTVFDHTSVLRSVIDRFGLPDTLGQRVTNATGLDGVLQPQPRVDAPTITPPNVTWSKDQFTIDAKLSDFQKELLALAIITAGDVFRDVDVGGLLGDLLTHVGSDIFAWFAKLDQRSESFPIIQKLMELEQKVTAA